MSKLFVVAVSCHGIVVHVHDSPLRAFTLVRFFFFFFFFFGSVDKSHIYSTNKKNCTSTWLRELGRLVSSFGTTGWR